MLRASSSLHHRSAFTSMLSGLRPALIPLRATAQDKSFLRAVQDTRSTFPLKMHVVYQFTGSGKSYTAQRCATRSKLFSMIPFSGYPQMFYIDSTYFFDEGLFHPLTKVKFIYFTKFIVGFLITTAGTLFVAGTMYNRLVTKKKNSFWGLLEEMYNELPSRAGLLVLFVTVIFGFVRARRAVVILDNPAVGVSSNSAYEGKKVLQARRELGTLSGFGHARPVLMITSNDGIAECFDDNATGKREHVKFEAPKQHDIVNILNQRFFLPHVTQQHIDLAFETQLHHHAASIRWWQHFAEANQCLPLADDVDLVKLASSRSFLWIVAVELDLNADVVFRAQALSLSQKLTGKDEWKLRVIFNQNLKLQGVPRRLALATALVETATKEEVAELENVRGKLLKAGGSGDFETNILYSHSLLPIVRVAENKLKKFGAEFTPGSGVENGGNNNDICRNNNDNN